MGLAIMKLRVVCTNYHVIVAALRMYRSNFVALYVERYSESVLHMLAVNYSYSPTI